MPEPEPALDVAVVVPVYQGELTLERLLEEIAPLTYGALTPAGRAFRVAETVLVHDGARDRSAEVMAALAGRYPFLRLVWLSRNFGQHAATLAGMASTTTSWVATLDEDGQQDPHDVGRLLDEAAAHDALLVYACPPNRPPHGSLRNAASAWAKWAFVHLLGNRTIGRFNSFRLVRGDVTLPYPPPGEPGARLGRMHVNGRARVILKINRAGKPGIFRRSLPPVSS